LDFDQIAVVEKVRFWALRDYGDGVDGAPTASSAPRWLSPQTGAPRRVGAVEALAICGLIRAQRSSLAEGDARERAWA
jgi:hypothetical protein